MSGVLYRFTRVWPTHHQDALRASIARNLFALEWRRHGIGCLQAYLRESDDHEVRIHIWHPSVVRDGIVDHGDMHDHRFRMVSTVLHGTIEHTEADIEDDPDGEWGVYTIVHAREDIGARHQAVPGPLAGNDRRVRVLKRRGHISAGETYEFVRGAFHHTRVDGLAVTVVSKYDQTNDRALVVAKPEPVHAFEKDDRFDPTYAVHAAIDALRGRVTA